MKRKLGGPDSGPLALVALSASVVLVLLQAYRVFIPYLVFEVDQSERGTLAAIALTVFAFTFLGALLVRLLGTRATLGIAAVALAVGRLAIQFSEAPDVRWIFGAATVVACFWLLIVILPQGQQSIGLGVGFAFLIDLLLRAARDTLDLPWMPGIGAHVLTAAIVTVVILSASVLLRHDALSSMEMPFSQSLGYIGIGPGIALWLVAVGNPGFSGLRADRSLPAAFALMAFGVLAGILLELAEYPAVARFDRLVIGALGLASAVTIVAWSRESSVGNDLLVFLFAFAVTVLTMRCASSTGVPSVPFRWRTGVCLTAGMLLQTAFVFLYFARTGPFELLLVPLAILVVAALFGARPDATVLPLPGRDILIRAFAVAALVTVLILGWMFIDESERSSTSAEASGLTVMTFNIQEGFSNENIWSLEETARAIEANDPDIVILQETTRGWLVMSSVDQVRWLAERLDMDFAYAGASYDGLWGNAVLSRLPIVSTDSIDYSTTQNLRRSALAVEVETSRGALLVIDTHLDNPKGAVDVRLEQISELLELWDGATPAIIAGDFNADPGSPEWQAMADAGFVDSGDGVTETTSEDERRIDYVWITPDLQADAYTVPDVWVSDHRPVVVEVAMPA